jgi:hypothetical protein
MEPQKEEDYVNKMRRQSELQPASGIPP